MPIFMISLSIYHPIHSNLNPTPEICVPNLRIFSYVEESLNLGWPDWTWEKLMLTSPHRKNNYIYPFTFLLEKWGKGNAEMDLINMHFRRSLLNKVKFFIHHQTFLFDWGHDGFLRCRRRVPFFHVPEASLVLVNWSLVLSKIKN